MLPHMLTVDRNCSGASICVQGLLGGHWYSGGFLQRQPVSGQPINRTGAACGFMLRCQVLLLRVEGCALFCADVCMHYGRTVLSRQFSVPAASAPMAPTSLVYVRLVLGLQFGLSRT